MRRKIMKKAEMVKEQEPTTSLNSFIFKPHSNPFSFFNLSFNNPRTGIKITISMSKFRRHTHRGHMGNKMKPDAITAFGPHCGTFAC